MLEEPAASRQAVQLPWRCDRASSSAPKVSARRVHRAVLASRFSRLMVASAVSNRVWCRLPAIPNARSHSSMPSRPSNVTDDTPADDDDNFPSYRSANVTALVQVAAAAHHPWPNGMYPLARQIFIPRPGGRCADPRGFAASRREWCRCSGRRITHRGDVRAASSNANFSATGTLSRGPISGDHA